MSAAVKRPQGATAAGKAKPVRPAMGDLLFEIGCEEIPAGMIAKAAEELKSLLQVQLSTNGLVGGLVGAPTSEPQLEVFGAPRRLTAIVRGVRVKQEDVTREITG